MNSPLVEMLRELAGSLFYPSEEDAPLEVVVLGVGGVENVVRAFYTDVGPLELDAFFSAASRGGFATAFPENVEGFAKLRKALEASLESVRAFVVASGIELRVVAGRDPASGRVVAITAKVVET